MGNYTGYSETLFSSPNIIQEKGLWYVNDKIFFQMYTNATNVNAYYITKENSEPQLYDTDTEEVIDILEMTF